MGRYQRPRNTGDQATQEDARHEKLTALHLQLEDSIRSLRTSDDWTAWLGLASRLHRYSFNNILLIHTQRPDATAVAGYRAWQDLGRQVDKGERGIQILAPVVRRQPTQETPDTDDPDAAVSKVVGFRVTHTWDVSQTSGDPLPERPTAHLLQGRAPEGLWDSLADQVRALGFELSRDNCGDANGLTNFLDHTVRVRPDLDDAHAAKSLTHELGHVLLHQPEGGAPVLACRGTIEVEAESLAYLVTASHGMPSDGYTFPYVLGWASTVPGRRPEDVVADVGGRVVRAASRVLDHGMPDDARAVEQVARRSMDGAARTSVQRDRAEVLAERVAGPTPAQVRERLLAAHADAAEFYVSRRDASWVPDYLDSRALGGALLPGAPWLIGYAPDSWTALTDHLRQTGYSDQTLETSGLSLRARTGRLVDRFRDRLMLAIRDGDGQVAAFVGRAHPEADERTPKYLNSPTTAIYRKSEHLFGLAEARTAIGAGATPTVTEGPMDAVAVHLATDGRIAGVALCGTAISKSHAEAFASLPPGPGWSVVVATDPDTAGYAAAQTAYHRLRAVGLVPWSADLPPGIDPAELLQVHGGDRLTAALTARARPLVDDLVDRRIAAWSDRLRWVEGRVGAVRAVAPLLAGLDPQHRQRLVRHVVDLTGVAPSTVTTEIAAAGRRTARTAHAGRASPPAAPVPSSSTGPPVPRPVHRAPARR